MYLAFIYFLKGKIVSREIAITIIITSIVLDATSLIQLLIVLLIIKDRDELGSAKIFPYSGYSHPCINCLLQLHSCYNPGTRQLDCNALPVPCIYYGIRDLHHRKNKNMSIIILLIDWQIQSARNKRDDDIDIAESKLNTPER